MSILNSLHVFESKNNDNNYKEDNENNFISGGYDISKLLDKQFAGGGGTKIDIFTDLQIPLGLLQCDKNEVINDFFKPIKSKVIDDDLFDNLFNLVSKNKTKNKSTRKEKINKNKITKKKTKNV
jgi:hypothetical protein